MFLNSLLTILSMRFHSQEMVLEEAGTEPGGWEVVKQQENKQSDINDASTVGYTLYCTLYIIYCPVYVDCLVTTL